MKSTRSSKLRETSGQGLAFLVLPALFCLIVSSPAPAQAQRPLHPAREVNWHAMGDSPCIWPTDETARHVDAKIRILRANGLACYVANLWGEKGNNEERRETIDLSGLEKILPAFNSAGISVWVVLVPPSEGGNSEPFREDYVRWMQELAKLSLKYPYLRGVNIDDFQSGISRKTFTPAYTCTMYRAKGEINPKLQFAPTIYSLNRTFTDRYAGCIDGAWLWWTNLDSAKGLAAWLESSQRASGNRFPIYSGVYAHSTSWHKQGNPRPTVLRESLKAACQVADGALIWRIPLTDPPGPLLREARRFGAGGPSKLAGRCGPLSTGPQPRRPGKRS